MWKYTSTIFVTIIIFLADRAQSKSVGSRADLFQLSIIHLNDIHARFQEIYGDNPCQEGQVCVGGFPRVVTMVKHLRTTLKNTIYLNAGDNFQGTLWYNILRGNATAVFLNHQPPDVITIGNHEFDHQIDGVIPFLDQINAPVVVANMDASMESRLQGKYKNSHVLEVDGRKVGVIGIILRTTYEIASTEDLIFYDEAETARDEAAKLKADGVDIIIVLSHSGLEKDKEIARNAGPDIDIVVGAHSHSFMWSGPNPPTNDTIRGEYPEIIEQDSGHKVLVVQAFCHTKYLGNITLWFDDQGNVVEHEGLPVHMSNDIEEDPSTIELLAPYKDIVDAQARVAVGKSYVTLSRSSCYDGDCNVGNLICDAFVDYYVGQAANDEWSRATVAFTNNGGIRADAPAGDLNMGILKSILPFDNTVDIMELKGEFLWKVIEHGFTRSYNNTHWDGSGMLQVSGMKIVTDVRRPKGTRVLSIDVLCRKCEIPEYRPLNMEETYRVITTSFISNGGDAYSIVKENRMNYEVGPIDIDVVVNYFKKIAPVTKGQDGRIKVVGKTW